jgi:organic radical activating enzyme
VLNQVVAAANNGYKEATRLLVITGGEPLLQNIVPLCRLWLHEDINRMVQIETAGTVWIEGLERYISDGRMTLVCSPKTGKVHPQIQEFCYDWKYLIQEGQVDPDDGLPNMSTQVPGKKLKLFRPTIRKQMYGNLDTIWLQPCEAYKVGYKTLRVLREDSHEDGDLGDQEITSSVRDEEQSQRNISLAAMLAMEYNYRISLQLHKYLKLP